LWKKEKIGEERERKAAAGTEGEMMAAEQGEKGRFPETKNQLWKILTKIEVHILYGEHVCKYCTQERRQMEQGS
jgi:IS1 family transposase